MQRWHFTSESVTEGHPDKVADRISDAVLDAVLSEDAEGRVACEVMVTANLVVIAGEITAAASPDLEAIARRVIRDVGYQGEWTPFSADTCEVKVIVQQQSPDISDGVTESIEWRNGSRDPLDQRGAGDQGMMFGYATGETPELMPAPIQLAHRMAERLAAVRKNGALPYLRPDGKTQVSVVYEGQRPVMVDRLLISTQHDPTVSVADMTSDLWSNIVEPVVPGDLLDDSTELLVNPSGRFEIGGPSADTGLTGRKVIVDTYGGFARHGGGAFSGKDPSKVDRSAAYAARHAAKSIVAAGLADRCEVQLAYAIGRAHPFSVGLDTFSTGELPDAVLAKTVYDFFDFRPNAIIERLDLLRPIYEPSAAYGHFGRERFSWERTDLAPQLAEAVSASPVR